jgi:hypothetical protein
MGMTKAEQRASLEQYEASKKHLAEIVRLYGGDVVQGDLLGFFKYRPGASLLGTVAEYGTMPTEYDEKRGGPCPYMIIEGKTDSLMSYDPTRDLEDDEVCENVEKGRIRLLLLDAAERKAHNPKRPIEVGERVFFHVAAKLPIVGSDKEFWSVEFVRFPQAADLPPWDAIKMRAPKRVEIASRIATPPKAGDPDFADYEANNPPALPAPDVKTGSARRSVKFT